VVAAQLAERPVLQICQKQANADTAHCPCAEQRHMGKVGLLLATLNLGAAQSMLTPHIRSLKRASATSCMMRNGYGKTHVFEVTMK
jgi:hypothetical protein